MALNTELYERVSKIETHQQHILSDLDEIKKTQATLVGLMNQGKGMQKLLSFGYACVGGMAGALITFISKTWAGN